MLNIRYICSFVANIVVVILTIIACLIMMIGAKDSGSLSARSIWALKYFTLLSNLLAAVSCIIIAVFQIRYFMGNVSAIPAWAAILQLIGTSTVLLTFFTVLIFLGPAVGHAQLYKGANFFLHLIDPIICTVAFCLSGGGSFLKFGYTFLPFIPVFLYAFFYTLNLIKNGVSQKTDFYGIIHWGWGMGVLIFLALLAITWGSACGLRAIYNAGIK